MRREAARRREDQIRLQQHLRHEPEVRNRRDDTPGRVCPRAPARYRSDGASRRCTASARDARRARYASARQRRAGERMIGAHQANERIGEQILRSKRGSGLVQLAITRSSSPASSARSMIEHRTERFDFEPRMRRRFAKRADQRRHEEVVQIIRRGDAKGAPRTGGIEIAVRRRDEIDFAQRALRGSEQRFAVFGRHHARLPRTRIGSFRISRRRAARC